jgi:hypothetical protein
MNITVYDKEHLRKALCFWLAVQYVDASRFSAPTRLSETIQAADQIYDYMTKEPNQ